MAELFDASDETGRYEFAEPKQRPRLHDLVCKDVCVCGPVPGKHGGLRKHAPDGWQAGRDGDLWRKDFWGWGDQRFSDHAIQRMAVGDPEYSGGQYDRVLMELFKPPELQESQQPPAPIDTDHELEATFRRMP